MDTKNNTDNGIARTFLLDLIFENEDQLDLFQQVADGRELTFKACVVAPEVCQHAALAFTVPVDPLYFA